MLINKDSVSIPNKISTLLTQIDELLLRKTDYHLAFASFIDRVTRVFTEEPGLLFIEDSRENQFLCNGLPAKISSRLRVVPTAILEGNPADLSSVRIPLYDMDTRIASLHLAPSAATLYTPDILETISVRLSLQLTMILQKCRANYLIARDPVTQQYNQTEFTTQLERAFAASKRFDQELCVISIEINETPQSQLIPMDVKDQYLSERLKTTIRQSDLMARAASGLFQVFLPNTTPDQANVFQTRLTQDLLQKPLAFEKQNHAVSVTMGIASMGADNIDSASKLVAISKERLQARKKARLDSEPA